MNKLSALALGAALALSAPLAISAQNLDVDVDAGVGVEAGEDTGIGVDASVDATADTGEHRYSDLMTALQGSANADLEAIGADANIEIVVISDLEATEEFDTTAFADVRSAFETEISALQTNVGANGEITTALEAEGYGAEDVVAVWVEGENNVTVFVDA